MKPTTWHVFICAVQDQEMRMNLKRHALVITFAVISVLTTMVSAGFAQGIRQEPSSATSNGQARTLRGVWRTVVTPRNCQTGQPFPSLPGLFTFNQGGTMSEYGIGPGSSPALRSPGHGVWQREHGWQEYSFAFTYYRYNASGVFMGSQKVTAALELGASGDEFATRSAIEIFDDHDNLIGAGCATAAGTRFE
jgi:hypothetical protein